MKNLQHKYYEAYKDNKPLFPGLDISWLKELREEAIAQFKKDGFPDESVEEWNNHSYKNLKEKYFTPFSNNKFKINSKLIEKRDSNCVIRVIFYNGTLKNIEYDNLPEGIEVNNPEELKGAIIKAQQLNSEGTSALLDVKTQPELKMSTYEELLQN